MSRRSRCSVTYSRICRSGSATLGSNLSRQVPYAIANIARRLFTLCHLSATLFLNGFGSALDSMRRCLSALFYVGFVIVVAFVHVQARVTGEQQAHSGADTNPGEEYGKSIVSVHWNCPCGMRLRRFAADSY